MKKIQLAFAAMFMTAMAFSQGILTGTVNDGELGGPLPGATVRLKGTNTGTSTDFDGNFTLEVNQSSGTLLVSYIGFLSKEVSYTTFGNVGAIVVLPDAAERGEVVVTGVMDIAKDRGPPVAVSTIKASEIVERLGSQEFPEILRSTPSLYTTKQGGGYGDSRINVRGFDQRNTAVMINGVPV